MIALSLFFSALLRLVAVYCCARGCVMLSAKQKNYRTPPWYVVPAIGLFGAVTTASVAELIQRAFTRPPPQVLLTGYGISVSEALLGLALYLWLLGSWLPAEIQEQRQRRSEHWRAKVGVWPCVRRRWALAAQMRADAQAAVAAGHANRALHADCPPVMEDLGAVIPENLRRS
ncbi:MAG: hypothetical protein ACYDD1_18890 [Caulobacteraceae bacterium]